MNIPALLSQLTRRSSSQKSRRRHQRRSSLSDAPSSAVECVEDRRLLSATNDLAALSDEFDADTTSDWQRVNEVENWNADQLQTYDINQTQSGRMVMAPHSVVWYQNWRGPMAFKEVSWDFAFPTQVHISDRDDVGDADADDVPDDAQLSLGGVMIRTPRSISDPSVDWQPGSMANDGTNNGENYVFLSLGHGTDGQFSFEVKTTRNSNSQLYLTPVNSNTATLQVARIGNTVLMMRQLPGEDWVVHERYSRPDMPETLQVGIVSYTDWQKASDFDPFYHNGNVLPEGDQNPTPDEPYNPDLVAGYEYARYVRPQVPAELQSVDLLNEATDEQILSFLGANANIPAVVDPPADLPIVSINAATDSVGESNGNVAGFTVSRNTADLTDSLTVNYSASGTAQANVDYDGVSESVVIPAGAASVQIDMNVFDDVLVEGTESVELQLLDHVLYELGDPTANIEILDNDFELIGDQVMFQNQDVLTINLPSTHPDGTPLAYAATVVAGTAHDLDQEYDFYVLSSYYENWGGLNERWIRGGGAQWFFTLPDGSLNLWHGSFDSSEQIASFDGSVYDDPTLLVDVDVPAEVAMDGNQLLIDPRMEFVGSFDVDVVKSNGHVNRVERISVTVDAVSNAAPQINAIADQTISHSETELRVPFVVSDDDGDALNVVAQIVQPEIYQLDQEFDFTSDGNYHENWGGQNERWVTANEGEGRWYYLLPNGQLFRWEGSFEESSVVADLGTAVYSDPALLTDAQAVEADVFVDGNEIVVQPDSGFIGPILVNATVSDGLESASTEFEVTVTNDGPVLSVASELTVAAGGTVSTDVTATDANGDELIWSVEVVPSEALQLDADLDFQVADDFYTNWGGQNEKWLRSSSHGWHFITTAGEVYRWTGDFESSDLVATLNASFYEDPNLIADAQPLSVSASITGNVLSIAVGGDVHEDFEVRVTVSDGLQIASQLVNVSVGL